MRLGAGDVLDERFRLMAELGEGGMSRVYEAVDLKYDRAAAVKVLSRTLAEDEEFRQRFEREANAAERVNHPHVLPVWHHGEQGGLLYLVTPLCDTDIGGLLDEHGPLEAARALAIIAQVAWALDWAHGRGVVHRDIKPENILLVSGPGDDHAYIADFGLAKSDLDSTLTQAGHPAGLTPAYAAPEQWLGDVVGPPADQYALAATLYTCLCGHPPFHPRRGPSLREAHLNESPPALDSVVTGLPGELAATIGRGLAKSPAERFGTCRELVTAAQAALQRERHAEPPIPGETQVAVGSVTLASTEAEAEAEAEAESEPVPAPAPKPTAAPAPVAPAARQHVVSLDPVPAPPVASAAPSDPAPRRRVGLIAAGLAVAVVVAVALVVVLGGGSDAPTTERTGAANVLQIPVGAAPIDIATGAGGVWVANQSAGTVTQIAARDGTVSNRAIRVVADPFGVAVAEDRVWVVGSDGDLVALDPGAGRRLAETALGGQADGLAAGLGAVWVLNGTAGTVTRVDVASGRAGRRREVPVGRAPSDIAVGLGAVWVVDSDSATLIKLDPATGAKVSEVKLRRNAPDAVAVGEDAVWVTSAARGHLLRVDPGTGEFTTIKVGSSARDADVAVGDGAVFYVNHGDGTAVRVDPRSARVVGAPIRVTGSPVAAVVAARALWVADNEANTVARLGF